MINRITEKEVINNIYKEASNKSKSALLIIYAKTGVGKTILIDTIFKSLIGSHYIRLKINQQQAQETKGFYLSSLAKALNIYAHQTSEFSSFEEFISTTHSLGKNGEKAIDDLLDIAFILVNKKDIREKINEPKKAKEGIIKKILESDNEIALSFLLEYITYISENRRIILCIENIQNANPRLISFLNELLKKTKNLFLVGEYTISNSEFEVTSLFQQFPYEYTSVYELIKLDKAELLGGLSQIIEPKYINQVHKIIETSYDESSGNLANLQLLLKKNTITLNLTHDGSLSKIKYDNALHDLYSSLTNSQKICLWYIVSHLGRVHSDVLNLHFNTNTELHSFYSLTLLKEVKLIKIENGYVSILHDSIIELVKLEDDSRKYLLICNQGWLNFYRDVSIRTDFLKTGGFEISKDDLLALQLTLILNIGGNANIDWMNTLLGEISKAVSGSLSYSLLSKVVSIFYQVVATNENQNLIYSTFEWIAIILSKLGQWEQLAKIIGIYKPDQISDLLFLLQANSRVAICDTTIKKELEEIKSKENSFLYIGSQLLLLRYYRTFSKIKKARLIWKDLKAIKSDNPYKYIIDDQINLCSLNFKKRQKFLQISAKGHYINGDLYQYCSTLLNINANSYYLYFSKLLRKKKFIQIASENLTIVKNLLPETNYPLHVYINQKTLLQFVEGNVPCDVMLKNFQTAYSNCGVSGNKVLIGSNIVAVGLKYNRLVEVAGYVDELMYMSKRYLELGSEFAKYPLINCYNYYYQTRNRSGARDVLHLLRKNASFNDVSDYLLTVPYLNVFVLRFVKYYPCNIYNWDVDFETVNSKFK